MHIGTFPFVLWIDVFLLESEPVAQFLRCLVAD